MGGEGAWSFVHVSDIQVGSPRSFRFAPAWNENWRTARRQIIAQHPDLLLVGGDLTRDGTLHDFELGAVRDDLAALPMPHHAIPGNMDVGNKHASRQGAFDNRDDVTLNTSSVQLQRFARYFGDFPWTFVHKNVRFSGIYAALAGSSLPEEETLWRWLELLANLPKPDHHVLMMHYALFIDALDEAEFDMTSPEEYHAWYFSIDHAYRQRLLDAFIAAGVDTVISGHIHCRKPAQVQSGITFYKAPATCSSQFTERWSDGDPHLGFLCFEVRSDCLEASFIPLASTSSAPGYGPGGHPKPEARNYTLAWEKP